MTVTRYGLHPSCRVRKETFGLLFYDLRGPRLLFAETSDLLEPEFFLQGGAPGEALRGRPLAEQSRVERFLSSLVRKGFLVEQPVC
ncbi:MAG: mycofactocin biosynthesis chaperone MftB [Deltaproteobacteria bacterium]|nr:mycofactocin biosynthesis chaperone MftB [Deltaproteobacteria bacterium]